jgi:Putative Tad-like Flp pilus-assembly
MSRTQLQVTADAAALSGAGRLPNDANVGSAATATAAINMPTANFGNVLASSDIVTGNWNSTTRVFTPGTPANPLIPKNAVRITTKRTIAGGNAAPLFFAAMLGYTQTNVVAQATAQGSNGSDCETNGFIAQRYMPTGSTNRLYGFCWYARLQIDIGSGDYFDNDSSVGSLSLSNVHAGSNNTGLSSALFAHNFTPPLPSQVGNLINALQNNGTNMPPYITQTVNVSSLPSTLVPGTAYIVSGSASIPSGKTFSNVVIIANGDISIGSTVNFTNAILASRGNVAMGSTINVGDPNYCSTNSGSVQLLAHGNVQMGSSINLRGVQMIAGIDLDMGSNNSVSAYGVTGQAGRDVKMGSGVSMYSCGSEASSHVRFSLGPKLRLVN